MNKPFPFIFICPNCGCDMEFKEQITFDDEYYDKHLCTECPLIVLDWRAEKEEESHDS